MSETVLVTEGAGQAFRDAATATITVLIQERESLDQPIHVDLDTARDELGLILDEHAGAIAELTVNGAFDLIEMQRGAAYDPQLYNQVIATLDNAALVAEADAVAGAAEGIGERITRRKLLIQRLSFASQTVARGILVTAIQSGLAAAGITPAPIPPA